MLVLMRKILGSIVTHVVTHVRVEEEEMFWENRTIGIHIYSFGGTLQLFRMLYSSIQCFSLKSNILNRYLSSIRVHKTMSKMSRRKTRTCYRISPDIPTINKSNLPFLNSP